MISFLLVIHIITDKFNYWLLIFLKFKNIEYMNKTQRIIINNKIFSIIIIFSIGIKTGHYFSLHSQKFLLFWLQVFKLKLDAALYFKLFLLQIDARVI